jgi:hypothetical protein
MLMLKKELATGEEVWASAGLMFDMSKIRAVQAKA